MSYLITSNVPDQFSDPKLTGINKPFSYFNNLQNTHILPANSEIAVQSVKINKDGLISVNRSNNKFFLYYGEKLSDVLSNDEVTSHVTQGFIYKNGQTSNTAQVNVEDFADMLQDSIRRTVYHPNLQISNINVSGATAVVKRNSSDVGFEGFEICFESNGSKANIDLVNDEWITATFNQRNFNISNGSGVTNNTVFDNLYCVGTEYPLSLTGGSIEFNLDNLGAEKEQEGEWAVGLTRCVRVKTATGNLNPRNASPQYFSDNVNPAVSGGEEWWDYMVTCEDEGGKPMLKIYQSLYDPASDTMEMEEFDYRNSREEDQGDYVNINASDVIQIRFTATGEQMKIESFSNDTGKYEILVDGKNASSVRNLKPINQCCWNMYPKIKVPQGKNINILNQDSVNITGHVYGSEQLFNPNIHDRQLNQDWWATMTNLDRQHLCEAVDSRYMCTTDQYDGTKSRSYTQKGLAVTTGTVDFNNVMILAESQLYTPTKFASSSRLLGFPNRPIVDTATSQVGGKVCFESDSSPNFMSGGSVFIRLKNFTLSSQNFAKGSESKIVYHLPRFDNSGNETGALFFEPSERMYLKLNNPNQIFLNDIDVEFVYSDEKLCQSLVGKTIVCFHVRESSIPLKK